VTLHAKHREWIEARGISVELAEKFGLETVQRHGKAWLSVPYVERGRTVNHKYRLISEKRHEMDTGGRLTLWNHDCLLEESRKPVVICEGEWDGLVAESLGYRAVSVPNGASGGDGELSYLWDARDLLNRVDSFILATDSDEPGMKLRANLLAHLGADRCSFVDYGADCKDLNETLVHYGAEAARHVLDQAKPFPVQGLCTVDDLPDEAELTVWQTGIDALNDVGDFTKPALNIVPGTLTVFTGYANAERGASHVTWRLPQHRLGVGA
jgi:twinkle protein